MFKNMNNFLAKATAVVLALVVCISTISFNFVTANAADTKAGSNVSFSKEYKGGKYYTALKKVTLTGDMGKDLIAVAKSQIGYHEGNSTKGYSGETKGSNNYTEYGRWNYAENGLGGKANHYWCASFISWCARCADIPTNVIKNSAGASAITDGCKKTYTRKQVVDGEYTPKAGDLVYYSYSHVGIIESYNPSTKKIVTIEGNTGNDDGSNNGYYVRRYERTLPSSVSKIGSINTNVPVGKKLEINMTKVPSTITKGNVFNLEGTVISNKAIESVTGSIISGGKTVQKQTVKPNSTYLDIKPSNINQKLSFGKLETGKYTLKIDAKDKAKKTVTYKKEFTVVNKAASTLKIKMTKEPTTVTKGKIFNLEGTVTSNYNITSVTGSLITNGKTEQTQTVKTNSKKLDIKPSNINQKLAFAKLAKGKHTLKIVAKDSSGKSVTYTKEFTVGDAASTLKINMTKTPSTIKKGKVFNLEGTVTSNYNITSVTGYIICSSKTEQTQIVKPNSKKLDIKPSNINQKLSFGKLATGNYILKIVAKDSSGKTVSYTKPFNVVK